LPAGQAGAALADVGVVPLREPDDVVVDLGQAGGVLHRLLLTPLQPAMWAVIVPANRCGC
jgi:hypothetical protein